MNHTKGEWEVGVGTIKGMGEAEHILVVLADDHHKIIASTGFAGAPDEPESIANAQLIAANPDMYEALKKVGDLHYTGNAFDINGKSLGCCVVIRDDKFTETIQAVKHALAKAEVVKNNVF